MPGYQPVTILQPSSGYFCGKESIYGHIKSKKKSRGSGGAAHPLFEDLKARNARQRMDYETYLSTKDMLGGDIRNYYYNNKFDSLKLLGSCNDLHYLDSFMSMPRQRRQSVASVTDAYNNRSRSIAKSAAAAAAAAVTAATSSSSSSTPPTIAFGKLAGDKRHANSPTDSAAVTAAMLCSLRSSTSEDNLYESVEMIHYLKTMQSLNRQKKTRSLQKTGHPLFDSLREEQAMREPYRKTSLTTKKSSDDLASQGHRIQEFSAVNDGGNSQSSSSSGDDDYDMYPRLSGPKPFKTATTSSKQQTMRERRTSKHGIQFHKGHQDCHGKKTLTDNNNNNGSESDDEFKKIIPRPKLVGRDFQQRRRSDVSPPSEESDSSFNSAAAVLR